MCRPGGGGDELPIHVGFIYWDIHIPATRAIYIWAHGWVSGAAFAFDNAGCGQELGTVANSGDRFVLSSKC